MSGPYREAPIPDAVVEETEQALAGFDVSGRAGRDGAHGPRGADGSGSGGHGGDGKDGGPSEPGQDAGEIRLELVEDEGGVIALRGERRLADGTVAPIRQTIVGGEAGFVELTAIGGDGGTGGDGGAGGNGARGRDGRDATRYSSGTDGDDGGHGGDGGNATSGSSGGRGGAITVRVSDADTPLLMLLRHELRGGAGGKRGRNGGGGSGGVGGEGGDSYRWSEDDSYTDSNGERQTRTTWHSNSGGSDGRRGRSGASGNASASDGTRGADGTLAIEVTTEAGVQTYPSRYDLRLVGFSHDSLNEDAVHEPEEIVRVFGLEVENTGGMPTPAKDDLQLSLVAGGWVKPEPGELSCVRGLAPGARHQVAGELRFRIAGFTPEQPGEPLEVEETIVHRAMLPSVRRALDDYHEGAAVEAGRFVIRFPVRLSAPRSLRSLAAGETTRVRFAIVNQSRFALGAGSPCKRVLRVRVTAAADSELGDEHAAFAVDGARHAPSAGWLYELDVLEAGGTRELELELVLREDAPEYRRFAARIALELGHLDEPAQARPIQYRAFDVRVARPFTATDADLLLVVNHRTTREEIVAWETLGEKLSFRIAVWDLSRERHLDLEAPLAGGLSLGELLAGRAIAILDNEIDGPDGPIHPHRFLCPEQALRAARTGLDIAFLGKGPGLDRMLVPAEASRAGRSGSDGPEASLYNEESVALAPRTAETTTALVRTIRDAPRAAVPIFRRYWLRWWKRPRPELLAAEAHALSEQLAAAHPDQRHLVVHRFGATLASQFLWVKTWRLGVLETVRTLDRAAGALVHVALDDAALHDPAYPFTPDASGALLCMFDFDENLERLRRLATAPDADAATLDRVVDALVLDLANELAAGAPGLPRLAALSNAALAASYDSIAGGAVLRLAGRLQFFAHSQVGLWDRLLPWRRATVARAHVTRAIDQLLCRAFGDHNLATARADVDAIARALVEEHAAARKAGTARKRRDWALALVRAPLAVPGLTSDTALYAMPAERVLDGAEYDAITASVTASAKQRAALVASADQAHRDLAA